MGSRDSGKWSNAPKGDASVSSASGQQRREPYGWRRVVEDREREQSGTDRISYPKKVIKEYKVAESIDAKESSKQPAAIGHQLWGMPTFQLGMPELDELRNLSEQSHMQSVSPNDAGEASEGKKPQKSYRDAISSVRSRVPNDSGQNAIRKDVEKEWPLPGQRGQGHKDSISSETMTDVNKIGIGPVHAGEASEGKKPQKSYRDAISPDQSRVPNDSGSSAINSGKGYKGGDLYTMSIIRSDRVSSGGSRVPNDSGQNAIRKDVEKEWPLPGQRGQEHRSDSASSRVRANFGEIEIDTIQSGNVEEYLDKLRTIKSFLKFHNTISSTTDKRKKLSNEILKNYHVKIKEMQIKSQKMFKKYEINKIKDVDKEKVKEFFSMLEEVDQSICLSYDLKVSPEAKEEVERIKSLISSYDEISKRFCNSEFTSLPDGSIKEQSSLLGELLSKNEEDLNKYRKLEQESPKEAALQRLEYSYLKRQREILNEAWQALSNLQDNKGKKKSYLDAASSGISNKQADIRMNTAIKWYSDEKPKIKGKICKKAEQFKILSLGTNGKQLCDDFKKIHEQNCKSYLPRIKHIFNRLKEINKKEEISEKKNRIIADSFQEIIDMAIKSFDMFLKYEINELDKIKHEIRRDKNENQKNNKKVIEFFRLLDDICKEIHYKADLEELSSEGRKWYKALEPLHKTLMELYDMDKDKKTIEEEKFNSINRYIEERFILYLKLCDSSPKDAAFYRSEYSNLKLIRKKLNDIKNKGLVKG